MATLFFRPEWPSGVVDKYKFSTNVLLSKAGNEQRIKLRGTPSRIIQMSLLFPNAEQLRKLIGVVESSHSGLVDVPLWWDARLITNTVNIGGTSLTVDTTNTEFTNGNKCLIHKDDDTWESVTLSGVTSTTLTVSATAKAWVINTAYAVPILSMRYGKEISVSRLNRAVGIIDIEVGSP